MIVPPQPSRGKPIAGTAGDPAPNLTAEQRLLLRLVETIVPVLI